MNDNKTLITYILDILNQYRKYVPMVYYVAECATDDSFTVCIKTPGEVVKAISSKVLIFESHEQLCNQFINLLGIAHESI